MTVAEFFGCAFLAFGAPFSMFIFTIAHDPIRVILLIASAFFWLLALLLSSLIWFIVVPLREYLIFGVVVSVLIQEGFRYIVFRLLDKTSAGLKEIAGDSIVSSNKHILAYVAGLGFGVISGIFQLVNILADMVGPATMGLHSGNENFFLISATQTLFMILLHTFWAVIFFAGMYKQKKSYILYVVVSHMLVSCLTLLNSLGLYWLTLLSSAAIVCLTAYISFVVAGGNAIKFRRFITCQQ